MDSFDGMDFDRQWDLSAHVARRRLETEYIERAAACKTRLGDRLIGAHIVDPSVLDECTDDADVVRRLLCSWSPGTVQIELPDGAWGVDLSDCSIEYEAQHEPHGGTFAVDADDWAELVRAYFSAVIDAREVWAGVTAELKTA